MRKRSFVVVVAVALALLLSFAATAFGATDPAVIIVSPGQSVFGDNILVSVKLTEPKTIKVYAFEEKRKSGDKLLSIDPLSADVDKIDSGGLVSVSLMKPETYTSTGTLKFYNRKIENVSPGLYRIKVETLDGEGKVIFATGCRVVVLSKTASGSSIFENDGGLFKWVQNFLKSVFGS